MTYVFGREVTVKLPEPSHKNKYRFQEWWPSSSATVSTRQDRFSINIRVKEPKGLVGADFNLSVIDTKALAAALLAAADYAENGDQT